MDTMARMEEGMKTPKKQRADLYLKIGVECSLMFIGWSNSTSIPVHRTSSGARRLAASLGAMG